MTELKAVNSPAVDAQFRNYAPSPELDHSTNPGSKLTEVKT